MATVDIRVLADASQAQRELSRTDRALGIFGKGASKIGKAAAIGFAAAAVGVAALGAKVVDFSGEAITAASNLEQSTGAVEAVFGKQASGIRKAAESAAQGFGLSTNAYQELASTLGAGLKNKGIKDFSGETQRAIGLGADLAAQFGGPTSEAVEAIGSLMRGEADPIEKYGVSINETAISAELAAKGQDKLKGAALEQAKAQARLSLLFKQTKDAQGAFGRESDTLAGKQARNAAAWENLKAKIGNVFLPGAIATQEFIANKLLPVIERMIPVITAVANQFAPAVERIKAVVVGLFNLFAKGDYTGSLGRALGISEDDPIIDKLLTLREQVISVFNTIKAALVAFVRGEGGATLTSWIGSVRSLWATVIPIVLQVIGAIVSGVAAAAPAIKSIGASVVSAFQSVASIITSVAGVIRTVWAAIGPYVLPIVRTVFTTVVTIISGAVQVISGVLKVVASLLKGDWAGAWKGAGQIVRGMATIIGAAARGILSVLRTILSAIVAEVRGKFTLAKTVAVAAFKALAAAVSSALTALRSTVAAKISAVVARIRSLFSPSTLVNAGRQLISGLVSGISQRISDAVAAVRNGVQRIRNLLPGSPIKDGPLRSWNNGGAGKRLMALLARGLRAGGRDVERELTHVLEAIASPTVTPRMSLAASGLDLRAPGGNTYLDVRLEVQPGVTGAQVGADFVRYVRDYERATGRKVLAK